jgi:hypothetical protein
MKAATVLFPEPAGPVTSQMWRHSSFVAPLPTMAEASALVVCGVLAATTSTAFAVVPAELGGCPPMESGVSRVSMACKPGTCTLFAGF